MALEYPSQSFDHQVLTLLLIANKRRSFVNAGLLHIGVSEMLHQDAGLHLWYSVMLNSAQSNDSGEHALAAVKFLRSNPDLSTVLETVLVDINILVTDRPSQQSLEGILAEHMNISTLRANSSSSQYSITNQHVHFVVQVKITIFWERDDKHNILITLGHRKWS